MGQLWNIEKYRQLQFMLHSIYAIYTIIRIARQITFIILQSQQTMETNLNTFQLIKVGHKKIFKNKKILEICSLHKILVAIKDVYIMCVCLANTLLRCLKTAVVLALLIAAAVLFVTAVPLLFHYLTRNEPAATIPPTSTTSANNITVNPTAPSNITHDWCLRCYVQNVSFIYVHSISLLH